MSDDTELSRLCRSCGLCCDGTLFAFVPVLPEESLTEPIRRRLVVTDQRAFRLPCPAYEPAGCGVYAERPTVCRSYACALLRSQRDNGGALEPKLAVIARVRVLASNIREHLASRDEWVFERLAELLEAPTTAPPEVMLDVAELAMRLQRDFGWSPRPKASG